MSAFCARSASEDQLLTLQFDQFCENEEEMCSAVFANSMVVRRQRYCPPPHARKIDRLKLLSNARQIDRLKLLSVSRLQIQARQIDRLKLLSSARQIDRLKLLSVSRLINIASLSHKRISLLWPPSGIFLMKTG